MTPSCHGFKEQRFISCSHCISLVGLHYQVQSWRLTTTSPLPRTDGAHRPRPHVIHALASMAPRKKEPLCAGAEKASAGISLAKASHVAWGPCRLTAGWKEGWKYLDTALMRCMFLQTFKQLWALLSSMSTVRWVWTSCSQQSSLSQLGKHED